MGCQAAGCCAGRGSEHHRYRCPRGYWGDIDFPADPSYPALGSEQDFHQAGQYRRAGPAEANVYEAVRLTIQDRSCTMDVLEVPDTVPVLIGQIPLEHLDLVIDMRSPYPHRQPGARRRAYVRTLLNLNPRGIPMSRSPRGMVCYALLLALLAAPSDLIAAESKLPRVPGDVSVAEYNVPGQVWSQG